MLQIKPAWDLSMQVLSMPALKLYMNIIYLGPVRENRTGIFLGGNRHEEQEAAYNFLQNSK